MSQFTVDYRKSTPVSYSMYVDEKGKLASPEAREVCECGQGGGELYEKSLLLSPEKRELVLQTAGDLRRDAIFRRFLGSEKYKEVVAIPFLQAVWGHRVEIKDLVLLSADFLGDTLDARNVLPDVVWWEPNIDKVFVTEMQRQPQDNFFRRICLYMGKTLSMSAQKGKMWDHKLAGAFVLGIADFDLGLEALTGVNEFSIRSEGCSVLDGVDRWMFIDLPKVRQNECTFMSELAKWLFFFNNFDQLENMETGILEFPAFLQDGAFREVFKFAKDLKRTKMEEFYDTALELYKFDFAKKFAAKAEAAGIAKGRAEAEEEIIKRYLLSVQDLTNETPQAIAGKLGVDLQQVLDAMQV